MTVITIRTEYGQPTPVAKLDDISLAYELQRLTGVNVQGDKDEDIAKVETEIAARAARLDAAIPVLKADGFEVLDIGGGPGSWRAYRMIVESPGQEPKREHISLPALGGAETERQAWAIVLRHNPLS